jgi:hypothetical protein
MSELSKLQQQLLEAEVKIAEQKIEIDGLKSGINEIFDTIEPIVMEINAAKGIFKVFKWMKLVGVLIDEIAKLGKKLKK